MINGEEDKIIDKSSALEKYTGRYLTKGENFRSKCFIKMIIQLPLRKFHPEAVKRHTDKYLEKLKSEPLSQANQAIEIEIIPYEDLWELIIDFIGKRGKKK